MPYEKVIEFCKKEGMSVHVFEKESGLGNGTVRGWKTGSPRLGSLEKAATRMRITVKDLLE